MRLTSGGNVGIGTAAPTVGLDVVGYGKFHGGGGYATPTVALCSGAGPGIEFATNWYWSQHMVFRNGKQRRQHLPEGWINRHIGHVTCTMLHIGCNTTIWGNLGIGTDAPAGILEIDYDQNALTRVYFDNNTAGTGAGAGLLVESDTASFAVMRVSVLPIQQVTNIELMLVY